MKPIGTTRNFFFCHCCFYTFIAVGLYVNDSCDLYCRGKGLSQEPQQKATGTCFPGVVLFLLMVVWWGETCCAPNSLEPDSCYMPIGARTDHGPGAGNNRTTSKYLGTESCCLTNCFGFLFCHQLVPHLVPNFPRVPLRNVSWGLGVCAVFVRSVSPCRLVPEARLFPSPPCAVFGRLPFVCPFFSSSCLSGLTRLWPGVCV